MQTHRSIIERDAVPPRRRARRLRLCILPRLVICEVRIDAERLEPRPRMLIVRGQLQYALIAVHGLVVALGPLFVGPRLLHEVVVPQLTEVEEGADLAVVASDGLFEGIERVLERVGRAVEYA
jgi:hypothetical protein